MAKFNIEGIGEITLPDDSMWARDETMKELVNALTGKAGKSGKAERDKTDAVKKGGREVKAFGKTLFKMNPGLLALEKGFNMLGTAISGAAGVTGALSQMTGRFEDLGVVVDYARDMTKSLGESIPIIGGLIAASADAAAELTKMKLALFDLNMDTFESLARTGFRASANVDTLVETVLGANISLEQFQRVSTENANALRVFGGTATEGAKRFAAQIEDLTGDTSGAGMELRLLGLNSESIVDEFAEFITANRFNTRLMSMDAKDLQSVMVSRIKAERTLAEFTGQSVREQQEEFRQQAANAAFQANLIGETYQTGMTQLASVGGPLGDMIMQISSPFNTVLTDATATFSALTPGLDDMVRSQIAYVKGASTEQEAIRRAAEARIKIEEMLGKRAQTAEGKHIMSLGMVNQSLADVGQAYLQGMTTQMQLNKINAIAEKEGKKQFESLSEAQAFFNKHLEDASKRAAELAESGNLSAKSLANLAGIDESTAGMIIARMEQEESVGDFQKALNNLVDPLTGMTTLISDFNNVLQKILGEQGQYGAITKNQAARQGLDVNTVEEGVGPDGTLTNEFFAEGLDGKLLKYNKKTGEFKPYYDPIKSYVPDFDERAFGGSTYGNQLYLVGEKGPELFVPSTNGTILPDQSMNVTTPGVSRMEDNIAQASSTQTSTVSALTKALTTSKMTTSDPEAVQELMKMNRMLSKMLPKLMTSEGIY